MAIGVFDSGVGGLTVHHRLVERFPTADFVYLADQANAPYGDRPGEEIVDLTRAGCIRLIEAGAGRDELAAVISGHVQALKTRIGRHPDRAILGCTHYEIVADLFQAALPAGTPLIRQPDATADALSRYLERHPEFHPGDTAVRRFLTTGTPGEQNKLVETFWGASLSFEPA